MGRRCDAKSELEVYARRGATEGIIAARAAQERLKEKQSDKKVGRERESGS